MIGSLKNTSTSSRKPWKQRDSKATRFPISGKPGYFSRNNTAYWQQKKYIGVGPSAHSYDGIRRGWNINNNPKYLKAIQSGELPMETEFLSEADKYNEYVMTGLRTIWGVSLSKIESEYGKIYGEYLLTQAEKYLEEHLLYLDGDLLLTTKKGRFLADGIAGRSFYAKFGSVIARSGQKVETRFRLEATWQSVQDSRRFNRLPRNVRLWRRCSQLRFKNDFLL